MKARRIKRRQLARAQAERKSSAIALVALGGGVVLVLVLLTLGARHLTPQTVGPQVARGEKINLTETNLAPLTNANLAATNLPPQAAAAQVPRGEKINLTITPGTNLALTHANFAATNLSAADTNLIGLPLAPLVTNTVPRTVVIAGETYKGVTFGQLAGFSFQVTKEIGSKYTEPLVATAKVLEQIPPDLKELNEQAVALTGYMLPVKLNEGLVTNFMLLPNTLGCCFGRMPRINEFVIVNTTGKGFKPMKDIPITIGGTFRVGAIRNEYRLMGIYQMDCEQVVEASSLTAR
jgi:hypothetical protein